MSYKGRSPRSDAKKKHFIDLGLDPRGDIFTDEDKLIFLDCMSKGQLMFDIITNVLHRTYHTWVNTLIDDPLFGQQVEKLKEQLMFAVEQALVSNATGNSIKETVTSIAVLGADGLNTYDDKGNIIYKRVKHKLEKLPPSDKALMLLARAYGSDRYKETIKVESNVLDVMTPEQIRDELTQRYTQLTAE